MVRAADTLDAAGFEVSVVSVRHTPWADAADRALLASRRWPATRLDFRGRVRRLLAKTRSARSTDASELSSLGERASAFHAALVDEAIREPADFIYGGSNGAIAAVAVAAARLSVPYAVDFEDAHGLEPLECGDTEKASVFSRLEAHVVSRAQWVSAAGQGVATYLHTRHGAGAVVLNNVFARPTDPPASSAPRLPLKVYWFSQTIGPRRGLEMAVHACRKADVPIQLTLRGLDRSGFVQQLRDGVNGSSLLEIRHEAPGDPDLMVTLAREHHVGLSLEDHTIPHRDVCTPNKFFAYLAAGLAVAATPTTGQRPIVAACGGGAVAVSDAEGLARLFGQWSDSRTELESVRTRAWEAARSRWCWEHPAERDAFLAAIESIQ
jgi:hypothetical protein